MAALTSTISLLEVVTSYFVDEKGWSRRKSAILAATASFLVGIPSALSVGSVGFLTKLFKQGGEDKGFLDLMDLAFGNFSLVIGAFLISLFTGWFWKKSHVFEELTEGGRAPRWLMVVWFNIARYVCPVGIAILLVNLVISLFAGGSEGG